MKFWPHKATDESAPIEPISLEQALKEYPDEVQLLESAPVHYLDPVKPRPRRRKK
jgi:hypothetical protein